MLARMTSTEVTEWLAYERVAGPLGPARGDINAATVAATVYNGNRGRGRRAAALKDFIPRWDRKARQTWQEQLAVVKQITAAMRGADTSKGAQRGDSVEPARSHRRRRGRRQAGRAAGGE